MSKLKIAVQKSGRLNQESLELLKNCGIAIDNGKDQLKANARNFPMEVLYLRNGDIPQYLRDGVVDIAILGENTLIEKGQDLPIIQRLGFSKCKVSIAVPKNQEYKSIVDLRGKKIATSYPNTVNQYFEKKGEKADIRNWGPVFLLNVDFKISSTSLWNKLKDCMEEVVHQDQTCGIKGRSIFENIIFSKGPFLWE